MARSEWLGTTRLIERALGVLAQEWPMTIRQLFYRLVSAADIGNPLPDYKRVSRLMTKGREDGRCPFEWIVDRSRPEYVPQVWAHPQGYAETVTRAYRKDYWTTQPVHVEVWVEKDAIIGSIEGVTDELGVTVRVSRGFVSMTKIREIAALFDKIAKPKVVFYLGDHDPSGRDIARDLRERVQSSMERPPELMAEVARVCKLGIDKAVAAKALPVQKFSPDLYEQVRKGKITLNQARRRLRRQAAGSGSFSMRRLAIHAADIQKFDLPPLRVKSTDSRATAFLSRYGNNCGELDALPPAELRRRIRQAVEGVMDRQAWDHALRVEVVARRSIIGIVSRWPTAGASVDEIGREQ